VSIDLARGTGETVLDLGQLAAQASSCTRCDLYRRATQTVFGEGPTGAAVMLCGEQPGDREDLSGHPFVGPAGQLLDRAVELAGLRRGEVYVTNAVKHFKWEERGKRRLHQRPNRAEIAACRPWLEAELALVAPAVVGALGATAAESLLGTGFRVTRHRGETIEASVGDWHGVVVPTVHPSSVLRMPDDSARKDAFDAFVADLRAVAAAASLDGVGHRR
jgi:uracil-DNA glycosylase family protein